MELKERARGFFAELQQELCSALQQLERRARFREDRWEYLPGQERGGRGGGVSRLISDGELLEKAGVNLADVHGTLTPALAERLKIAAQPFEATGLSVVIHPLSPMVPTAHMNLRYIQLRDRAWFGGGADLTPYYLYEDDAAHFHRTWRAVCERHDAAYYPRFKQWCDEYFTLRHRGERRGIGGIFFDYLAGDLEQVLSFVQDAGRSFAGALLPIIERRRDEPWGDRERRWQLVRRGRYVEFNLIYDRGTLFGLETEARTESILMSLPPLVRWIYDHRPEPGSREERLLEVLQRPREWA
jgi:coproporphyrinogen III oxidase